MQVLLWVHPVFAYLWVLRVGNLENEQSCRIVSVDSVIPVLDRSPAQASAGIQEKVQVDKHPAVYILANKINGTLYVGVTSDLRKLVWQLRMIESGNPTWRDNIITLSD